MAIVMRRGDRFTAKIMAKGQITIPIEIRRAHGWHEGDTLELVEDDQGGVCLRVAGESIPDYRRFIGSLSITADKQDVAEWIEELRGPIEAEEEKV